MKTALTQLLSDLLAALVYLAVFALTGKIVIAASVAVAVALLQFGLAVVRKRALSLMQWMGLGLVVVLSALTLITKDSRFIQLKPTIAHIAIGVVMLKPGWQLPYLPPIAKELLPPRLLIGWGYAWAGLMFAMGLANLAATQWLSLKGWGLVLTGLLFGKLIFFFMEYASLRLAGRKIRAQRSAGT
jgi:intracellular septation protein